MCIWVDSEFPRSRGSATALPPEQRMRTQKLAHSTGVSTHLACKPIHKSLQNPHACKPALRPRTTAGHGFNLQADMNINLLHIRFATSFMHRTWRTCSPSRVCQHCGRLTTLTQLGTQHEMTEATRCTAQTHTHAQRRPRSNRSTCAYGLL